MTQHESSTAGALGATVRRIEHRGEQTDSGQLAQLARLLEHGRAVYADAATRTTELTHRAFGPIQRVVEADPVAKAAFVELRERGITELEARLTRHRAARTFTGPPVPSLIPSLHAGINVFGPPFDFPVTGPNRGADEASADRLTGTFKVGLSWGKGGARWATAGLGMALQASATGFAHIRPAWRYEYQGAANGQWLSAHSEGAAKLVVQDAVSGAVLKEITRPLWSIDAGWATDDGYIDSWALGADVFVQAGQHFTVTFLATALVDDSGAGWAWSLACADIEMRVPFLVVELGP